MSSSPSITIPKSANEVLFMPWADIGQIWSVGPVTFMPLQQVEHIEPAVKGYLDRYFSRHVDPWGNPVRTITIISVGQPSFRSVTDQFVQQARQATDALFFSIYAPTVRASVTSDNPNLGPPTADRYQLLLQRFSPTDDTVAIRVGGTLSTGQIDRMRITCPWDVGGSCGFPDEDILTGFGKMLVPTFPTDKRERIFRSLEWFRLAHTVGVAGLNLSSDVTKIVMMATAFEILLEFPDDGKKLHFINCAEATLNSLDTLSDARYDRKGRPHTNSLPACWSIDFYELRSRIVHGDPVAAEDLRFDRWISHLIVADLVFWQFLIDEMYLLNLIGDSVRQSAAEFHTLAPGEPYEAVERRCKDDFLGFKELHQSLGWRPK